MYFSYDIFLDSLENNTCRTRLERFRGLDGDTCWSGGLFENLVEYASMVRDVVKLLLEHGSGNYINARVPVKGTPLDQFLILAVEMRAYHNYLWRNPRALAKPPKHKCKLLEIYGSGERLDEVLGNICDLLFDAGAVISWEDYEDDGTTGKHRLLRLLSWVDEDMILEISNTYDIG